MHIAHCRNTTHSTKTANCTLNTVIWALYNAHCTLNTLLFALNTAWSSDQRIVIFPANRNMNRFAEPTSVRIGIGIVREFQNLGIGIGIIFVRWEVFANYSRIPEIYFFSIVFQNISFSWLLMFFFDKLTVQTKP